MYRSFDFNNRKVFWDNKNFKTTFIKKRREKKLHRKSIGASFLCVFAVLFVAAARRSVQGSNLTQDKNYQNNNSFHSEPSSPEITLEDTDTDISETKNIDIDEQLLILSESDSRYTEIYKIRDALPEGMLTAVCRNSEEIDFALNYPLYCGTHYGGLTEEELSQEVPLLIQWDSRWGYAPYGDDIIGLSGCGPTCLSMAATALTDSSEYSPKYIADFAEQNNYYELGVGTSWSLITSGCEEFGLKSHELPLNKDTILSSLKEKKLIICSMKPGDFTAVGHYILLCGVDGEKIKVNDPNSRQKSSKLWSYDELEWQIANLWELEKIKT